MWQNDLRTEIITSGSDRVRSYDLSGKLLWEFSGMSTISIPTPFERFGLLYISSGYIADALRPAYAIRPGASGDISLKPGETSNAHIVWSSPTAAPYNPTPIIYGDTYYTLFDRGFFTSHEARTGKEIYARQRITSEASGFTSSPWAYNGKIFAMSEEGDAYVIQAGSEFKVLGKNSLNEMTLATPAWPGAACSCGPPLSSTGSPRGSRVTPLQQRRDGLSVALYQTTRAEADARFVRHVARV